MISVITPSVRPEGLNIVEKCLKRQTHTDYEWIVVMPKEHHAKVTVKPDLLLADPPKTADDFWSLCKAWNLAYAKSKGELIVNIQDLVWFRPDVLSAFWKHYLDNPKALVTAVGDHYQELDERGEPQVNIWQDPRKRQDYGTFYEIDFPDMEMTMCSIPKQALLDCGGIDELYDKGPGVQEKEMCYRLTKLDYTMWIDQAIEYKAVKHPRLTEDWDEIYWNVTAPMFKQHGLEIYQGLRQLNVNNLAKYG